MLQLVLRLDQRLLCVGGLTSVLICSVGRTLSGSSGSVHSGWWWWWWW